MRALVALVCGNGIRSRPLGRFNLDVVQNDWCQDHSWYSHESLANDQREQGKPDGIFDQVTDDFAVQEIFQLMDSNQEDESNNRQSRRHCNGDPDDDCVTDQVSNYGQQSAKEGQTDHKSPVLERDNEHEYSRQERVYSRNPDLSAHDRFKTFIK